MPALSIESNLAALVLALGLDAAFGYPDAVYRTIGHPVTWIGALIALLDRWLNREAWSFRQRRAAGIAALAVLLIATVAIAVGIERLLPQTWLGVLAIALLASTLIASRSLYHHVRDVAETLETGDLADARTAVARIVGRDPGVLDVPGVARAAIESLAENASDGVVAPVFWFAVLGPPGLVAYKAINTADSMIGHRSARHEAFGWAAARLDDLVNLPASRLTGALIALAACTMPGTSGGGAVRAMRRDAGKHRSPNAGWPESTMAGALGLKLNGPRQYGGTLVDDAYMGDGRREATAGDIRRALGLALRTWMIMALAVAMGTAILIARG